MRLLNQLGVAAVAAMGCLLAACQSAGGTPPPDGTTVIPSATLRQGQTGVSLVVTRAAGGLASATAFDLGGLVVERQPQSTDTRLVLTVSVPHGVPLGAQTLTFSETSGNVSIPNVLEVDAITSGPAGADTNRGTIDSPFRTLKSAIAAAGPGDTIELLDGTYDATAGETWGYTLPASVTISGQSVAGTNVTGPLVQGAVTPGSIALIAPAGLTMMNLTLSAFDTAINATGPGALTLGGVTVSTALTAALRAAAANVTVTVTGGAVSATQDAFLLDDDCVSCALKITGASFSGGFMNGHAVEITAKATGSQAVFENDDVHGDTSVLDATATLSVTGSTFKENGTEAESMINFAGQTIDVTSSSITLGTDNFGINLSGGTLTTSGLTIQGGNYGIYQLSGNTKLRDTKISGYVFMGFYLAQGALDLGTAMDRGGNAFSTGTTGALVFGLYVDGVTKPVTSSNTTFNGVEPPAGTQAAPATDPIAVTGEYFINDGTTMSFWTL